MVGRAVRFERSTKQSTYVVLRKKIMVCSESKFNISRVKCDHLEASCKKVKIPKVGACLA
jgi:hypothetical protein